MSLDITDSAQISFDAYEMLEHRSTLKSANNHKVPGNLWRADYCFLLQGLGRDIARVLCCILPSSNFSSSNALRTVQYQCGLRRVTVMVRCLFCCVVPAFMIFATSCW